MLTPCSKSFFEEVVLKKVGSLQPLSNLSKLKATSPPPITATPFQSSNKGSSFLFPDLCEDVLMGDLFGGDEKFLDDQDLDQLNFGQEDPFQLVMS